MEKLSENSSTESLKVTERFFDERTMDNIEAIIQEKDRFLGEGVTATVHSLDSYGVCCKIYRKADCGETVSEENRFTNSIKDELNILSLLKKISSPVRTPVPYYAKTIDVDGDRKSYLVMEKLNAVSLRDILEGRAKLPEKFDFDIFFNKIGDFVKKMHEMNIYHRDLHAGNIMIDEEGNGYVIDFGAGIATFSADDEPYRIDVGGGYYFNLLDDEVMVRNVGAEIMNKLILTKK